MNYNILTQALPQDVDGVVFDIGSLYLRLLGLVDPRKRRGRRYALAVVVMALLLAKLAGQDTPTGIAEWVRLRGALFVDLFQLKRSQMPHAATYRRLLAQPTLLVALER